MGRAAKLALIGSVASVSLALTLLVATAPRAPRAPALSNPGAGAHPTNPDLPRHCRAVTEADPACEAEWDKKRRRFFRQEKDVR